jgi:hypothetical protein
MNLLSQLESRTLAKAKLVFRWSLHTIKSGYPYMGTKVRKAPLSDLTRGCISRPDRRYSLLLQADDPSYHDILYQFKVCTKLRTSAAGSAQITDELCSQMVSFSKHQKRARSLRMVPKRLGTLKMTGLEWERRFEKRLTRINLKLQTSLSISGTTSAENSPSTVDFSEMRV